MPDESPVVVVTDWQSVADELSGALRAAILRNPNLTAQDWQRASTALQRYDDARRGVVGEFGKPVEP